MPELPEVETIKRVIEPQIQGLMIERVITTAIRLFTGLRSGGKALSEMRGNTLPHHSWRQGKRILPCLPKEVIKIGAFH